MKKAWLFAAVLLPAVALAGTVVYRWTDSNGVVHYSDQPHPGAVKVDLGAPQVVSFKTPSAASAAAPPQHAPAPATGPAYQVRILAPADGTTLRPGNDEVAVRVSVQPSLVAGGELQYSLDGASAGPPTSATSITLQNVYRGTHVLNVTALGPGGQPAGSASSTFYVHQHSILHNRNRPGPKPPPGGGG